MSYRPDWSEWILQKNSEAKQEELKKSGSLVVHSLSKGHQDTKDEDLANIMRYSQNDEEKQSAKKELDHRKAMRVWDNTGIESDPKTRMQAAPPASNNEDETYKDFFEHPAMQHLEKLIRESKDANFVDSAKDLYRAKFLHWRNGTPIDQKLNEDQIKDGKKYDVAPINVRLAKLMAPKVPKKAPKNDNTPSVVSNKNSGPKITRNGVVIEGEEAQKIIDELKARQQARPSRDPRLERGLNAAQLEIVNQKNPDLPPLKFDQKNKASNQ